jgi:hypothetical protein
MGLFFRGISGLLVLFALVLASSVTAWADCSSEPDPEIRAQCDAANQAKDQTSRDLSSQTPDPARNSPPAEAPAAPPTPIAPPTPVASPSAAPPTRPVDLEALLRDACGLRLRPTSGAPGERETIVVSAQRRTPIEQALPNAAPTAQLEALNVDACFSLMGNDYVLVAPPDKREGVFSVIGGDASALSRWLSGPEATSGRLRLAPDSDCAALLNQIRGLSSTAAVWVEQDHGPSRCERDMDGSAHLDPNKVDGYGGVIVLKLQRS